MMKKLIVELLSGEKMNTEVADDFSAADVAEKINDQSNIMIPIGSLLLHRTVIKSISPEVV